MRHLAPLSLLLLLGCVGDAVVVNPGPDAAVQDSGSDTAPPKDASLDAPPDANTGIDAGLDAGPNPYRVFLSNILSTGKLGTTAPAALTAADAICTGDAGKAGLNKAGRTFRAFLRSGSTPAVDRLKANGPWILPKSKSIVRMTKPSLSDGTLLAPINELATGFPVNGVEVWVGGGLSTGTKNCIDFTSAAPADVGAVGSNAATNLSWANDKTANCDGSKPVYCFEDDL